MALNKVEQKNYRRDEDPIVMKMMFSITLTSTKFFSHYFIAGHCVGSFITTVNPMQTLTFEYWNGQLYNATNSTNLF